MNNTEILIIGAGAAGLMAAYTLIKAGKKVAILEARNRAGGRIHTLENASFFLNMLSWELNLCMGIYQLPYNY